MAKSKTRTSTGSASNLSSSYQSPLSVYPNNKIFKPTLLLLLLGIFFATVQLCVHLDSPSPCGVSIVTTRPKPNRSQHNSALLAEEEIRKEEGEREEVAVDEEFWKQPDGMGYRPCLEFSDEYRRKTELILRDRQKYLLVVVTGGLNQQRNQIVDAVVIARILGAALVAPVFQVNLIWGDESEFSELFDLVHFKTVLANDVRIVSSLPSWHMRAKPVDASKTPFNASARWIRTRYLRKVTRAGVLLLRGFDSRLSKDLPLDLQKLRCKVAFQALRFSAPIAELGNKLTSRMREKGPYLALHLRLEKDVWVRTGCLPGLSHEYDELVRQERARHPELLTARSKITYHDRKLAGLCPLTAVEVTRLLKALGAPRNASIYWAGGEPLGGPEALRPIIREYPFLYNKENISLPGELEQFANRSSVLAAIDYIVSVSSDVFMQSHGGNMARAIQGHRAYSGHRKHISPNKREMAPYLLNTTISESEFNEVAKSLHAESMGQPAIRTDTFRKYVIAYPIPECMCNGSTSGL